MRTMLIAAAAIAALALPAAAGAQATPNYIPFTDPLPPTSYSTTEYQSGYNEICRDGAYACVDGVIAEMAERYAALRATCDHNGLFALTYLRTTEEYQRASLEPGFFRDPLFINHQDAIFAQFYFDAYDRWAAGEEVPRAWQIAFDASKNKEVSALGDIMLGISAHVNRDLAYTLATIALADPETRESRKPDHDKVNAFLARVPDPLFRELARDWDPSFGGTSALSPISSPAALALLQGWREAAWRWAERLVEARTDAERRQVERGIEEYATQAAVTIKAATQYGPGDSSASRDAYCDARN